MPCSGSITTTRAAAGQSGPTQPGPTQPGATQPGATQPGATQPGATQRQLDYLCQLARQVHGLGTRRLDALSQQLLGKPIAALTGRDASELIAGLQSLCDGEIALEDVFDGEAP